VGQEGITTTMEERLEVEEVIARVELKDSSEKKKAEKEAKREVGGKGLGGIKFRKKRRDESPNL